MIGFQGTLAPRLARSKLLQDSQLKNIFLFSLPFPDAVEPSRLKEIGFQPGFQRQEEIVLQNCSVALRLAKVLEKSAQIGFRVQGEVFKGLWCPGLLTRY